MIYETAFASIIIQFITAIIDAYGLQLPVGDNFSIIKEILKVELFVQIIELAFYIWLLFSIHSIKNITIFRYADWFITTPLMLITLMAYLSIDEKIHITFKDFMANNSANIVLVVFLNILMLGFGLLSELFPASQLTFVLLGFIPFAMYFYIIWKDYLQNKRGDAHPVFTRDRLYWYFAIIWSFYGIAALFPYVIKNTALNILDLFSKNAFGIMLVYIISHHSL